MNRTFDGFKLLLLGLVLICTPPAVRAEPDSVQEYQIKAAFLFNFIKFVDWPKEKKVVK